MKNNNVNSIEQEVLKRIKEQVNPNIKLQKQIKLLMVFWIFSCLFSGCLLIGLYIYSDSINKLEKEYGLLMYLPTLFIIILIFLGFRFQELKVMEFRNQSKFKDN